MKQAGSSLLNVHVVFFSNLFTPVALALLHLPDVSKAQKSKNSQCILHVHQGSNIRILQNQDIRSWNLRFHSQVNQTI